MQDCRRRGVCLAVPGLVLAAGIERRCGGADIGIGNLGQPQRAERGVAVLDPAVVQLVEIAFVVASDTADPPEYIDGLAEGFRVAGCRRRGLDLLYKPLDKSCSSFWVCRFRAAVIEARNFVFTAADLSLSDTIFVWVFAAAFSGNSLAGEVESQLSLRLIAATWSPLNPNLPWPAFRLKPRS